MWHLLETLQSFKLLYNMTECLVLLNLISLFVWYLNLLDLYDSSLCPHHLFQLIPRIFLQVGFCFSLLIKSGLFLVS